MGILERFRLTGKTALVVGGAGDLGAAMVEALAEAEAKTVVIDLSDKVFELCEKLKRAGLPVFALQADVRDRAQIRDSFNSAVEMLGGRLDILVNAAGIQRRHASEVFPESDWDAVVAVNLNAAFFYCQLAANVMIPNGGGKIINIASMQSFFGG